MSEWILLNERQPEVGETVLISQSYKNDMKPGSYGEVTVAYWNGSFFTWYMYRKDWVHGSVIDHGDICPGNEYVDAWMPLPKGFTEGDDWG